ncbi:MAG: HlyD family efflux transporter periplasmic adaptor subunit [Nitrosomonas sp.]|nr:HlyD family efflux transporter periplasmic adaptor subunit [Nitrosomonas sp.]MBK7365366.1 HlyD family efflux transporter periplasmic adaptor subunit [Nitrosomonas sp.]
MPRPFFRSEALAHQRDALNGEVLIARSPTIRLLVWVALLFTVVLLGLAFGGEYTRKAHVVGYLSPTTGMIRIYSPQLGTIQEKHVREGQYVKQGDPLLTISSERMTVGAREVQATLLTELKQRQVSLRFEQSKQSEIDSLAGSGIAVRIRGLETEIHETQAQLALQSSRVASAERMVARYQQLVAERFMSEVVLQQKQEELLDQRNQLAQIKRNIASLNRELNAARVELSASGLKQANNKAAIERQISELEQQLAETDIRRSITLTAPTEGTVTTLLTDMGQIAQPNLPLLSILPASAQLQAQLLVPSHSVGFIKPGQSVSLRYQAFPYQRFGHHLGEIIEVGRSVIQPNEANFPVPIQESVYRVTVRLPQQQILAYGQGISLQPEMVLDADIHLDRRRLIEWVFDPLLSITGRI